MVDAAVRALVLTTDAFGGHGGVAKYNRDFLTALCSHPSMSEVVAIPRVAMHATGPVPAGLRFVTDGLGSKAGFLYTVARELARLETFDAVFCGHINLLAPALAAAVRFRVPIILWVYGVDVWKRPNHFAPHGCAHINGFVSISRVTAERFHSWAPISGKREWIIPNAIELDRFSPGPKSPALLDRYKLHGKTVLVTLGRLVSSERLKGFDEVLNVLPRLLTTHPDLAYLIVGDGSDKARLVDKARSLGVADRVVFAGRIPESEKVDHYRLADAFAMPSQQEGFGFVFLEALACGIPVVAGNIDGGREAVRQGELGSLVDPRDPADVVRGIEEALAKPKGIVPEGLRYFAFPNFASRVHAFVDDVRGR
jgi:phosphatidylinositol alpha-1,6-mannosyltransferase